MKDGLWWLVHDPEQGHSSQVDDFATVLQQTLKRTVAVMPVSHMAPELCEPPEGMVLWCALKWYLTNRHSIKGRPWMGALSWCFDDLMSVISDKSLPGINLIDAGLNALWTNCPAYVQQTSSAYRCNFSFKPLNLPKKNENSRYILGVVLPNIADRDFSQLLWTLKYLKKSMGTHYDLDGPRIFLRASEPMRLPKEILDNIKETNVLRYETELDFLYGDLFHCIVPPRITDLRGGVVSPEIYQALLANCTPLVVTHPVWAQQLKGINLRTYDSLKQYGKALDIAVDNLSHNEYEYNFQQLCESPVSLAHKIAAAYQESTRASAKQPADQL